LSCLSLAIEGWAFSHPRSPTCEQSLKRAVGGAGLSRAVVLFGRSRVVPCRLDLVTWDVKHHSYKLRAVDRSGVGVGGALLWLRVVNGLWGGG